MVDLSKPVVIDNRIGNALVTANRIAHGPLRPDEKDDIIAKLDAVVAQLYGLSENQLSHVSETFHEGWDFGDRLAAVLTHFRARSGKAS